MFGAVTVVDRDIKPPRSFTSYRDNFRWAHVRVLDMNDIMNPLLSMNDYKLPVPSSKHSYLLDYVRDDSKALSLRHDDVPTNINEIEEQQQLQAPRIGMHHSTIFVAPLNQRKQQCVRDQSKDGLVYTSGERCSIDQNNYQSSLDSITPPTVDNILSSPPHTSYRTDTGLFLSWQVVVGFICLLIFTLIKSRMFYVNQKHKWKQELMNLEQSGDDINNALQERLSSSSHNLQSSSHQLKGQVPRRRSLHRVMSLPSIAGEYIRTSFSTPPSPAGRKNAIKSQSTIEHVTETIENESRGLARVVTDTTKSSNENTMQEVGTLDGIPLVQYSRYSSEFEEICPIGEGGFGTVFRCKNKLDDREYATKKIRIESFVDNHGIPTKKFSKKLKRVLREVKALALLDHPHIVRYYTAWLELDRSEMTENANGSHSQSMSFQSSVFFQSQATGDKSKSQPSYLSNIIRNHQQVNDGGWAFGERGLSSNFSIDEKSKNRSISGSDLGFQWDRSNDEEYEISLVSDQSNNNDQDGSRSNNYLTSSVIRATISKSSSLMNSLAGQSSDGSNLSGGFFRTRNEDSNDSSSHEDHEIKGKLRQNHTTDESESTLLRKQRHVLYIQMQHCEHALNEFLASPEKRRGPAGNVVPPTSDTSIDIPFALQLFSQIVKGVKYVHQKGLIHRDLKPSNCFLLDGQATIVKIGDFGLSRESVKGAIDSTKSTDSLGNLDDVLLRSSASNQTKTFAGDHTNTAGVGTYLYASPEQISGRDYDSSTDIFSLGVMLFELCFPMYTVSLPLYYLFIICFRILDLFIVIVCSFLRLWKEPSLYESYMMEYFLKYGIAPYRNHFLRFIRFLFQCFPLYLQNDRQRIQYQMILK